MNEVKKSALPICVWKINSFTKTFFKRRADRNEALDNLIRCTHWAFNRWGETNHKDYKRRVKNYSTKWNSSSYEWLTR